MLMATNHVRGFRIANNDDTTAGSRELSTACDNVTQLDSSSRVDDCHVTTRCAHPGSSTSATKVARAATRIRLWLALGAMLAVSGVAGCNGPSLASTTVG